MSVDQAKWAGIIVGVAFALAATQARAAEQRHDYVYTVKHGDTVIGVSEKHLLDPKLWREVAAYNKLKDPNRVSPGEALRIPFKLARAKPSAITVAHVEGDVRSAGGKDVPPAVLALGASLSEGGGGRDGQKRLRHAENGRWFYSARAGG